MMLFGTVLVAAGAATPPRSCARSQRSWTARAAGTGETSRS